MWLLTLKPKRPIDFHTLANAIAKREGKKESVNIAQICEILAITLHILAGELVTNPRGLVDFIRAYRAHRHGSADAE